MSVRLPALLIALALLGAPAVSPAASEAGADEAAQTKARWKGLRYGTDSWALIPLPVVFYLPETSVGGGAAVVAYLNMDPTDPSRRPDTIAATLFYTWNRQLMNVVQTTFYLWQQRLKFPGEVIVKNFPTSFYGLGPTSRSRDEERYDPWEVSLRTGLLWRTWDQIYLGPAARFGYFTTGNPRADGLIDRGGFAGANGARFFGAGLRAEWDTRDKVFYPLKGFFTTAEVLGYLEALGSTSDFLVANLEHRHFFHTWREQVVALHAMVNLGAGEVPFQAMQKLGGQFMMRGYYSGRFRDVNHVAVQAEYRIPIWWRLGANVFGGVAQVFSQVRDFDWESIKVAGGLGLRLALDRIQRVNLRVDFAFCGYGCGPDDFFNFYITVREAF